MDATLVSPSNTMARGRILTINSLSQDSPSQPKAETDESTTSPVALKYNHHATIHEIPAELLGMIFMENKPNLDSRCTSHGFAHWIRLTHVCQRWRNVALNLVELWTDLSDCVAPEWLNLVMERSKQAPVSVLICFRNENTSTALAKFLSQTHRLKELRVLRSGPTGNLPDLLSPLTSSAPILTELSLVETRMGYMRIPSNFLANCAPRLKKLRLRNCILPWTSTLFHRLTSLTIQFIGPQPSTLPDDLLTMMSKMTSLTFLDLGTVVSSEATVSPNWDGVMISLPRLKTLKLRRGCGLRGCNILLLHLQIPSSTTFGMKRISIAPDTVPILTPLGRSLSRIFSPSASLSPLQFVRIKTSSPIRFRILGRVKRPSTRREDAWDLDRKTSSVDVDISFVLRPTRTWTPLCDQPIISAVTSTSTLRMLTVEHPGNTEEWLKALAFAPRLHLISLSGVRHAVSFFTILRNDPALIAPHADSDLTNEPLRGDSTLYFAQLRTIAIRNAVFWAAGSSLTNTIPVDDFINVLALRAKLGSKTEHLQLYSCRQLSDQDICRIEDVVDGTVDVVWDDIPRKGNATSPSNPSVVPDSNDPAPPPVD